MQLSKGRQKRSNGFTIVEVMIVIAIAAFILLIVFLAVPSLRKSARNNARQTDVKLLLARVQEQVAMTTGRLPDSCDTGNTCFLTDTKLGHYDNSTADISWTRRTEAVTGNLLNPNNNDDAMKVTMTNFAKCDANNVTGVNASRDDVVATYLIETLGGHDVACIQS